MFDGLEIGFVIAKKLPSGIAFDLDQLVKQLICLFVVRIPAGCQLKHCHGLIRPAQHGVFFLEDLHGYFRV